MPEKKVMIIAGESSGELYGALLAKTLKTRNSGIEIIGVGGERMSAAGVKLISGIASSFGLTELLRTYSEVRKTFKKVIEAFRTFKPGVVVLIDYPDFNLRAAKKAKAFGLKVLYYVSPQIWAWRAGRIYTIAKYVDQLAVILPFEEKIYKKHNIPCEFTGHPAFDEIRDVLQALGCGQEDIGTERMKRLARTALGLRPDALTIALLPGSRPHEISGLLPVLADTALEISKSYPDSRFVIPVAPNVSLPVQNFPTDSVDIVPYRLGHSIKVLLAADFGVVASGTATLQAALLKLPMVVVYKLSPFTYFIGKLIVNVKHITLVNVLLDRADDGGIRVKELLQEQVNSSEIVSEIKRLKENTGYRTELLSQIEKGVGPFRRKHSSDRVAELVENLLFCSEKP